MSKTPLQLRPRMLQPGYPSHAPWGPLLNSPDLSGDDVRSMILPCLLQPGVEPLRRHVDHGVEVRCRKVEASFGSGDQGDGSKLSLDFPAVNRELER